MHGNTSLAISATLAIFLSSAPLFGQAEGKEPTAILEIGGEVDAGVHGGVAGGPTVAAEITPIENWLELEGGVTRLFGDGRAEWDTDLLFKKPYTLSKTAEFMFGIGPEWVHGGPAGGRQTNTISGEAALDFMFWPSRRRRFGWYLEPAYEFNFAKGHEESVGVNGGLLVSIP